MARTFRYGIGITGLCIAAVAGSQVATAGMVAASPIQPVAAYRAMSVTRDPTLGRAATLSAPPGHAIPSDGAPVLKICSFDGSRSRAPFATATGDLGYSQMRADLVNPAKFGPSGSVHRTVVIAPGVPTITDSDLAGCSVFFTSVFTGVLSGSEARALKAAYSRGIRVITDADSDSSEEASANSVVTALGLSAPFTGEGSCSNDAAGGMVRRWGSGNAAVYGPFGDLRGNSWGTSITAVLTNAGTIANCGTDPIRKVICRLFIGGDPSGLDLFTSPTGSLHNPTNEAAYLNFIGSAS